MLVQERFVPMQMDVWFFALPGKLVPMLVMRIVPVPMGVHERLVRMLVLMTFA